MAMQLLNNTIEIIMLHLTFGGALLISGTICDLANELLKCEGWNPKDLHMMVQRDIPPQKYLDTDVSFGIG